MNAPDLPPEPIDRLARAEAALKGEPTPEGPSENLIARTRAALRDADEPLIPRPKSRSKSMILILKFSAAAAAALAIAGLPYLATAPPAAASPFAEATEKLRDAHTLSYRVKIDLPGQEDQPMTCREFYKDPGRVRTEMDAPNGTVIVQDSARGTILRFDPKTKTATHQDWKPSKDQVQNVRDRAANMASHLRSLAGKTEKPVGKRTIGDVEAQGFRVEDLEGFAWTVWIDPKKKMPMLMETAYQAQGQEVRTSMSDFRIDPPLDDDLFQVDPPDGYTLTKLDTPVALGEEALINLLRLYAEESGGSFPPTKPDDAKALEKQFPKENWKGPSDPAMFRYVQAMARGVFFLQFELKNAYGYAPKDVKLGDADKILLWYHLKGSEKYRAIFGDLHADDVTVDRLPEKPKF